MDRKIRVGAVSYLNTKPLIYGFEQGMMKEEIDLSFEYPSLLAEKLLSNSIDIGLVPVAVIPSLPEYHIVSDYGIACDGEVASVCLFSDVPLEEITSIMLDYQSRTSVALLKVLLREYWNISPELLPAKTGFEEKIKGPVAGLMIGDRAFSQRLKSPYIYDLGLAWKDLTGLPFVFAAWVSNRPMSTAFIQKFQVANEQGLQELDKVLAANREPLFDLHHYYTHNIKYRMTPEMREAMQVFLHKITPVAVKG